MGSKPQQNEEDYSDDPDERVDQKTDANHRKQVDHKVEQKPNKPNPADQKKFNLEPDDEDEENEYYDEEDESKEEDEEFGFFNDRELKEID